MSLKMVAKKSRKSKITSESITKDFIEVHGNLYDYSKINYLTMHQKVTIICKIHGEFETLPNHHLKRKVGCAKCSFIVQKKIRKDNTKSFCMKAKKLHKDRYDYSRVVYGDSAHIKVKIVCKVHGEFLMSPNSHLSKKSNCPKCSTIRSMRSLLKNEDLGWSRTNWIKRTVGKIVFLYIIECKGQGESFIKIGITSTSLKRRFTTTESMPYPYKILKLIQTKNAGYIYDLERLILKTSKKYKYNPKIPFKGKTECRTEDFNYLEYL